MSDSWYYADARNQQQGPVEAERLRELHARGDVGDATLVWHAGLPGWEPLAKHADALGIAARGPEPMRAEPITPRTTPAPAKRGGSAPWVVAIAVLFIGIMVVGVIAAIALPAYTDHAARAKVAEAISLASVYKLEVDEMIASNGRCPDNDAMQLGPPEGFASDTVASLRVGELSGARCGITVELASGGRIVASRLGNGVWSMSAEGLPNRVLPEDLRR